MPRGPPFISGPGANRRRAFSRRWSWACSAWLSWGPSSALFSLQPVTSPFEKKECIMPEVSTKAPGSFGVHSEVGKLRKVLVCSPGLAHKRLTPSNKDNLLFDEL